MDPTTRRDVRRNWIDCLYEFASPTMQGWWTGGAPPNVQVSFVELMCGYFDDLSLTDGLDAAVREGWMSAAEAQATAEFHRRAESYEPPSTAHEAILADPAWAGVVDAARRAWVSVRAVLDDRETIAVMTDLETTWGRIAPGIKPQEPTGRDRGNGED